MNFKVLAYAGVVLLGQCDHPPADLDKIAAQERDYVALSPVAVVLPKQKVPIAAEYFASLRPNAEVYYTNGSGMVPRYKDGTALVVEKIPFADLREGMTALTRTATGAVMVHYIAKKTEKGWKTIDLSPDSPGSGVMTTATYVGVVVMAFTPEE